MNTLSDTENQDFVQWFLTRRHTEASLDCYHEQAVMVNKPGSVISGKHQISQVLADALNHSHICGDNIVIENGDVALVLSKLYPNQTANNASNFTEARRAIHVFKKDCDGNWQCVVDNMFGMELLDYV